MKSRSEIKGLQMEDYLTAVSEKLERTSLTKVSLQFDEKREEGHTGSYVDSVKDHTSAVSATQSENTVRFEQPRFSTTSISLVPDFHAISDHGLTAGRGSSSDPGLHISNLLASCHLASQYLKSNLSLSKKDASVSAPVCLAPNVGVNYHQLPLIFNLVSFQTRNQYW